MDGKSDTLFTLDGKEHVVKEIKGRNKRLWERTPSRNDKTKEHELPPLPEEKEKDYKSMYKKAKKDLFFLHLDYQLPFFPSNIY